MRSISINAFRRFRVIRNLPASGPLLMTKAAEQGEGALHYYNKEELFMSVKYVFVTGGVVSGLGKGITAASLGRLLKARGYKVTMQKFDPYINIDQGTMNQIQHG